MTGYQGRRRSDQDLRRAKLRITDPYQQDGLVHAIPPGAELVEIVNAYRFNRYPRERAHCAKCDRCLHAKGVTVRLTTGDLVLIGRDCAREVFGISFEQAEKRHQQEERRQELLLDMDVLVPMIPTALTLLAKWREACRPLMHLYGRFHSTHLDVFTNLRIAARGGGQLVAYRKVRNYAAEVMRPVRDDHDDDREEREIWEWAPVPLGGFAGADFFADVKPYDAIDEASAALREVAAAAKNTDSLSLSRMRAGRRKLRKAADALVRLARMHRAAPALFAADNLALIVTWANKNQQFHGRYVVHNGALVCTDNGRSIALPSNYPGLDETLLALLRDPGAKDEAA